MVTALNHNPVNAPLTHFENSALFNRSYRQKYMFVINEGYCNLEELFRRLEEEHYGQDLCFLR